ncbi:dephospho-CoA kinase [Dictyobacter kobayashii]|uniref:Dephospho-CoA kinase n=1 Tax=Dictyobacter kobayashii TaxID=2014872 RepID=A0A402AB70_9CHLR|nr:dephospho-CoA kinase [Dictyobacter kobayashii]GCE16359.1 dephospho-CoA kinase [Dictyobacter kobayashii]
MPYVIGITGNIACGKTSIGQMLVQLGAERYIDADLLVHHLYERDQPIAVRVADYFGPQVVAPDGSIDRKALGSIVFHDSEAMKRLEQIVHPAVHTAIQVELDKVSPQGIAILDAVKLLEGGSANFCQAKWLVVCSEEQQLQRLMQRNVISLQEAQARIKAQPGTEGKLNIVDEVIVNSGTSEATYQQVAAAFKRFCLKFAIHS